MGNVLGSVVNESDRGSQGWMSESEAATVSVLCKVGWSVFNILGSSVNESEAVSILWGVSGCERESEARRESVVRQGERGSEVGRRVPIINIQKRLTEY